MIDILVPVLSRPQNAASLVHSIKTATSTPHTILFLCSPGDEEQIKACRKTRARVEIVSWAAERSDYPKKMNYGYEITEGEYILMGADDIAFQEGWDTEALAMAEDTGLGVIGTNDCANKQVMQGYFSTHALVRRSYVQSVGASLDGPGLLVSESYDHNYCDRELCALAQSREQWAFAAGSKIIHKHPCWGTGTDDLTYRKGKKNAVMDHGNFFARSGGWGYVGLLPKEFEYASRMKRRWARLSQRARV